MADKIKTDTYFVTECPALFQQPSAYKQREAVYSSNGFTLVELLVVVAILGVLALMAIPAFATYIKLVKVNACAADLRTIDKAISAYFIEKNALPPSLSDIGMDNQLDPWSRPFIYENLSIVGAVPLKDIAGVELNIDYDLYSKGEDGASATDSGDPTNDDDIVRSNDGTFVGARP